MSEYVSCGEIAGELSRIQKGDVVYVVSDILELAKNARENGERFDRDVFLDSLKEAVGENGTLLIPTFNWDFCRGIPFDYVKTPGKTGALGNAALKRSDFKRTRHPIYSFAVWEKTGIICLNRMNRTLLARTVFLIICIKRMRRLW